MMRGLSIPYFQQSRFFFPKTKRPAVRVDCPVLPVRNGTTAQPRHSNAWEPPTARTRRPVSNGIPKTNPPARLTLRGDLGSQIARGLGTSPYRRRLDGANVHEVSRP
jgi:hypothetical protein